MTYISPIIIGEWLFIILKRKIDRVRYLKRKYLEGGIKRLKTYPGGLPTAANTTQKK